MDTVTLFWLSFLAGIYAPIGSPCVLVLYPGYISFLANRSEANRRSFTPFTLGISVAAGVIVSMLVGGLLFTIIFQSFGGEVRRIITAALFVILLLLSFFLILDIDYERYAKKISIPRLEKTLPDAFLFGMTFGIIILPCNAAPIAVLLALATSASGFSEGLGSFLSFGLGITLPIIIIASHSQLRNRQVIGFLNRNQRTIRITYGIFLLIIALWYIALIFVPGLFS